jgi:hypothetical protein
LEELYDKEAALRAVIAAGDFALGRQRFDVDASTFRDIPGSPFAYWVSEDLRASFAKLIRFEADGRVAKRGVNSNDDNRFLRLAWECSGEKWLPHVKGGPWSPYYADPHMLLNWGGDGRELLAERVTARKYKAAIVPSRELYLRPGLTWTLRTKSDLSMRMMPRGCVFGSKGPAVIVDNDDQDLLLALTALSNSQIFRALVELSLAAADAKRGGAARSYEVGVIQRTPVPRLSASALKELARFAHASWGARRSLDSCVETSHAFVLPALLQVNGATLVKRCSVWRERALAAEAELVALGRAVDELSFDLYGVRPTERRTILEGFGTAPAEVETDAISVLDDEADADESDEDKEDDDSSDNPAADDAHLINALLSWCVGVAFNRFDVRLATQGVITSELTPFDPLPSRSPGMWRDGEISPAVPRDIMVDDPGHARDLRDHVATVLAATGFPDPPNLRQWLAKEFFPLHIRMYSKSRRKAPIYWQLATPSASYSIWLYIHAFTSDTLFRVQNDYVAPKLAHEERRLERMASEVRERGTNAQRKELAAQESFVDELRAFFEEVKRIAPLWNPNLDDGVIVNFAPLWRLVPQHKAWQRELRSTWGALCEGKYDWSHLAMHLWPERVVPKCAEDRSLAIAHGLEDVFWVEGPGGKWTARKTPARPVDELVQERTSPAVKAALKSLVDAPQPAGSGRKWKKG